MPDDTTKRRESNLTALLGSAPLSAKALDAFGDAMIQVIRRAIDAVEARCNARMEEKFDGRIAALELYLEPRGGGPKNCGAHTTGRLYQRGSVVTFKNDLYVVRALATRHEPDTPGCGWLKIRKPDGQT